MSAPHDNDDDAPTVTLWWLQRQLGCTGFSEARLIRYVAALVADAEFPPPLPRLVRGRRQTGPQVAAGGRAPDPVRDRISRDVARDSRWRREPVEAWLADLLPPRNAAQVDAQALAAAAHQMDAAAFQLHLVAGGRP